MMTQPDAVALLYRALIDSWNQRDAIGYAALFSKDGTVIGFDGSAMQGRATIEATLAAIFNDHITAPYLVKVRSVRLLTPDVALLHAVAGMVPPGQQDLNPAVHAQHVLTAVNVGGQWLIAHFQNTPAQFHGRPEAIQALTNELRALL